MENNENIEQIIEQTPNDMELGKKIRSRKNKFKEELELMNDKYIRLYSDFENFKKRKQSDIEKVKEDSILKCAEPIIEVYDDIKLSLVNIKDDSVLDGINLILNKLKNGISKMGLEEISNDVYDPNIHDVISVLQPDSTDIIDVLSSGYKIGDRIVRYPKVILGKKQ